MSGRSTGGNTYPSIQFETDAPGSEVLCNVDHRSQLHCPAAGREVLPVLDDDSKTGQTLSGLSGKGVCVWNFGNVISGVTTQNFGKAAQYGTPDVARYGGTLTSTVMANPEFASGCTAFSF